MCELPLNCFVSIIMTLILIKTDRNSSSHYLEFSLISNTTQFVLHLWISGPHKRKFDHIHIHRLTILASALR